MAATGWLVDQPKSNLPLGRRACTGWFKPPSSSPLPPPPSPTIPLDRGWFWRARHIFIVARWITATGHFSVCYLIRPLVYAHVFTCARGSAVLYFIPVPGKCMSAAWRLCAILVNGFFTQKTVSTVIIIKINLRITISGLQDWHLFFT